MKNACTGFFNRLFLQPFPKKMSLFLGAVIPVLSFYLLEFLTHNPFEDINLPIQLYSILLYLLFFGALTSLFKRAKIAYPIGLIFLLGVGIANYYTLEFRSSPILPWDISSLRTGLSVADNQSFALTPVLIRISFGYLMLILLSLHLPFSVSSIKKRGAAFLGFSLLIGGMLFGIQTETMTNVLDLYEMPFTQWYTYRKNGFMVSFFLNAKYLNIDTPKGYDPLSLEEEMNAFLAEGSLWEGEEGEKPNIIVIMDEAFSDLSVLGELQTNMDPLTHFYEPKENSITGNLHVSVLGGNTANSEFEFLTGDTMAFLPIGSIPYQQYLQGEVPSLVHTLKDQGYQTIAMHPYYATGWNRNLVYPNLGFDELFFLDSFAGASRLRNYVSDQAMFQKIIQLYEKKGEAPLFIFGVTMQNHSSYVKTYTNFTPDVHAEGGNYPWADAYLSLIRQTDLAYRNLLRYFANEEEPTIILFFGDHQPTSLERKFFNSLMEADTSHLSLEDTVLRYQTPFQIWANYDLDTEALLECWHLTGQEKPEISLNYLGSLLFDAAGISPAPYQEFLFALQKEFPIITANYLYDKEGTLRAVSSLLSGQSADGMSMSRLALYQRLQYHHIFDSSHRINALFRRE